MLDRWALRLVKKPLSKAALFLHHCGVKADWITLSGFVVGILCLPALTIKWYWIALFCILFNRVADGLDGEVARLAGPTDSGAFLDIVLDFIFYGAVIFGFALAEPGKNSLAAAALLLSFIGTGSSFLAFAVMAERCRIERTVYPNKGIYYLAGLAEGTETILFFVLFCLFPDSFVELSYCFVFICLVTVLTRVAGGYFTLKKRMPVAGQK